MALTYSWNAISADQCDADSPIDEILMEAIRQNQIHLKEWIGKNYTPAEDHNHDGVNSKLTPYNAEYSAGNCYIVGSHSEVETDVLDVYAKVKEILVARSGALRISFSLRKNIAGAAFGRIFRNGVAVGTERVTWSSDWVTFTEDISGWSAGDQCQLYIHGTNNPSGLAVCSSFILRNSFYINEIVVM